MFRTHAASIVLLALGAVGLVVASVWVISIPTYACDEGVAKPSSWIYAGLVLFALGLPIAVFLRGLVVDAGVRLQRLFVVIALTEGVASVVLGFFLNGKYGHYQCG